jgi:hypothetical protein
MIARQSSSTSDTRGAPPPQSPSSNRRSSDTLPPNRERSGFQVHLVRFSGSLLLQEIEMQRMTGSDCMEEQLEDGRRRCG